MLLPVLIHVLNVHYKCHVTYSIQYLKTTITESDHFFLNMRTYWERYYPVMQTSTAKIMCNSCRYTRQHIVKKCISDVSKSVTLTGATGVVTPAFL